MTFWTTWPSKNAGFAVWFKGIEAGLLRCARNDGCGKGRKTPSSLSFPDVQLHIVDAPLGAGPESITTDGGYGFRARCCASPRNDGVSWFAFRDYGKDAFASCMRSDASNLTQP